MTEKIDPFKGLPRRLHIGYMTFRVVLTEVGGAGDLGENDYGSCDFNKARIYVIESLDLLMAVNTVMHEIRHAIHFVQALDEESSEEDFTNRGTNGEIEFLLRNPRFCLWLMKMLRLLRKEASRD